jgi:hypothetical protein
MSAECVVATPPAGTAHLGQWESTHRVDKSRDRRKTLIAAGFAVAIPIAGVLLVPNFVPAQQQGFAAGLFSMLEFICCATIAGRFFYRPKFDVWLFSGGIAAGFGDRLMTAWRWDDVAALGEIVFPPDALPRSGADTFLYSVRGHDGVTVALGHWLGEYDALRKAIRGRALPLVLERGRRQWAAGEAIDFGPLRLRRLTLYQGKRELPLDEVASVSCRNFDIVVRQTTGIMNWCKASQSLVPNVALLLDLVDRAKHDPGAARFTPAGVPGSESRDAVFTARGEVIPTVPPGLPGNGQPFIVAGQHCYCCGEPPFSQCDVCGREFCPSHGIPGPKRCNRCLRAGGLSRLQMGGIFVGVAMVAVLVDAVTRSQYHLTNLFGFPFGGIGLVLWAEALRQGEISFHKQGELSFYLRTNKDGSWPNGRGDRNAQAGGGGP